MVTEMLSTGQNDSWFDILDQLMEEVNQSHLEEVQWDSDKAQIIKVRFTKIRLKCFEYSQKLRMIFFNFNS